MKAASGVFGIDTVFAFGDSLSDSGNTFSSTGQPKAPYFRGRFSNGLLAVEYLADRLNAELVNNSWGGATTGEGNFRDRGSVTLRNRLPGMAAAFRETPLNRFEADSLVFIWGGANDYLAPSDLDRDDVAIADRAVTNIASMIVQSQSLGAKRFMVPSVPCLDSAPVMRLRPQEWSEHFTAWVKLFNTKLKSMIEASFPSVIYVEIDKLTERVTLNPEKYGFMNASDQLLERNESNQPGSFLYWDHIHPTTDAHKTISQALYEALL